jgi:PAS domain-containing protein
MQDHVSLQDALNAMTEQIAILSGDGVIVAANTAWQDHFWTHQSGSHDFVGHQFGDALRSVHGVSESDTGRILEGIGHVLRGRLPGFEVEYQEGRDEEARWFLMSATPLTQGHKGALITRRDITR